MAQKKSAQSTISNVVIIFLFFLGACVFAYLLIYFRQINVDNRQRAATGDQSLYVWEPYVSGLSIPTKIAHAPDGRIFVLEQSGNVRVIKNGQILATPFISYNSEIYPRNGLLGIAFDPNYSTNRYVYIYYTRNTQPLTNRVVRLQTSTANPDTVDATSAVVLLENIPSDPQSSNGGSIDIGPDGYLYIPVGVGTAAPETSQNLNSLNGKILRIKTDGSIPSDNPYVGQAGKRAEIWAYGLRNPYSFAFDAQTGQMFINENGSENEEINLGQKGANYGYPSCEGMCGTAGIINPLYTYGRIEGGAITGGVFTNGYYYFGDFIGGWIKRMNVSTKQITNVAVNTEGPLDMKFAGGQSLYVLFFQSGQIKKVTIPAVLSPTASPSQIPTQIPTVMQTTTPTKTPSSTPTRTPTATLVPSSTPTRTPTATLAPSSTPTRTPTATLAPSSTPTRTPTATRTPTPSATPVITNQPSVTPITVSPTDIPTVTPTPVSIVPNPPGWWWLIPAPLRNFLEQLYAWVFFFNQPSNQGHLLEGLPTPTP